MSHFFCNVYANSAIVIALSLEIARQWRELRRFRAIPSFASKVAAIKFATTSAVLIPECQPDYTADHSDASEFPRQLYPKVDCFHFSEEEPCVGGVFAADGLYVGRAFSPG